MKVYLPGRRAVHVDHLDRLDERRALRMESREGTPAIGSTGTEIRGRPFQEAESSKIIRLHRKDGREEEGLQAEA